MFELLSTATSTNENRNDTRQWKIIIVMLFGNIAKRYHTYVPLHCPYVTSHRRVLWSVFPLTAANNKDMRRRLTLQRNRVAST